VNRDVIARVALRSVAVAIATAAAIDPAITSHRAAKPVISVVTAGHERDSALAVQVRRALQKNFTVLPARFAAASATVLVGDALPAPGDAGFASPVFAVTGDTSLPAVSIEAARAPSSPPLDARVPVSVVVGARAARGKTLELSLESNGLVRDRVTRNVTADVEQVSASLSYLPTAAGATPLRIVAHLAGARDSSQADLLVDVRDTRWPILFYDPHPSWMSTFVRRAVERDRRFIVTSRVVTSRSVSTDAGDPPSRLDDLAGLSRFAAIVVGAPDGLTVSDVNGLDAFLRRRGGSVILLVDTPPSGPYARLTGVATWTAKAENPSIAVVPVGGDSPALRAAEVTWPTVLPAGAQPLAWARDSSSGRAIIWHSAAGAGDVVVSGALDAWRYRDPSASGFDRYWQTLIAGEASMAPAALAVRLSTAVVAPGDWTDVSVTIRDIALRQASAAPIRSTATVTLVSDSGRTNVRLWPGNGIGEFRGSFRAPLTPGTYRVAASSDGVSGEAPLFVAGTVYTASRGRADLLRAWVTSRGGAVFPASRLATLPENLTRALQPSMRSETWHPMRSFWWMLPFALALSAEWFMRRRRGLA
jgi:hypothetical protein